MRVSRLPFWILIAACAAASAADWPRFRGPNGTGTATGAGIPVSWTEASGILWKTPVPGAGNSSPIVSGNRIFLQSATADGRERLLIALDARDGRTLWSRSVPGTSAKINPRNTLASSSPATDGERVYALFWDGSSVTLTAHDLEGNPVWRQELGAFTSEHGAGASPVVYGGRVFLANDADGTAALLAFDGRTGKPLWREPRAAFNACYSSPFMIEHGGAELVVASTAGITAYEPDTGRSRWHWTWPFERKPLRTVGSPIFAGGLVFATSGDGGGDRHMVAVQIDGPGGKPSLVWDTKRGSPYVPTLLAAGEYLYWVNDLGIAACQRARTGENVWTERLGGNFIASPVLVDGNVYAPNDDGDVYVFRAAPKFELLGRSALGEMVRASPAVTTGHLLIRGRNHLFCIGTTP